MSFTITEFKGLNCTPTTVFVSLGRVSVTIKIPFGSTDEEKNALIEEVKNALIERGKNCLN